MVSSLTAGVKGDLVVRDGKCIFRFMHPRNIIMFIERRGFEEGSASVLGHFVLKYGLVDGDEEKMQSLLERYEKKHRLATFPADRDSADEEMDFKDEYKPLWRAGTRKLVAGTARLSLVQD